MESQTQKKIIRGNHLHKGEIPQLTMQRQNSNIPALAVTGGLDCIPSLKWHNWKVFTKTKKKNKHFASFTCRCQTRKSAGQSSSSQEAQNPGLPLTQPASSGLIPFFYDPLRTSAILAPALTVSPGFTNTFSIFAPAVTSSGTRTAISSFIASRIEMRWLGSSLSPSETSTFQTFASTGASMGIMAGSAAG